MLELTDQNTLNDFPEEKDSITYFLMNNEKLKARENEISMKYYLL